MPCGNMFSQDSPPLRGCPKALRRHLIGKHLLEMVIGNMVIFTLLTWDLGRDFSAPIHIEDIFYLGETRSIEDLTVLTRMPAERLCLGCGIRTNEVFCPILPGERANLFNAASRLLRLLLNDQELKLTDEERLPSDHPWATG